jgi:cyclic pyranopterin phosphate synthase
VSGRLTHLDEDGRARMVDVSGKDVTERECVARGAVRMAEATLDAIREGRILKGDVFATARLGAIQAAKRTPEWIPLAHPLPLDWVDVELLPVPEAPEGPAVRIEAVARARARTGVEMEALVAVTAAGLVIYDMCKAIDRGMTIEAVRLVRKRGGKSGEWVRPE